MKLDLSPRHRLILKALIEEYVAENRPVGSKTLWERYELGISPATIRNVFRDLEELGLIHSKHCSGGRVPTELGYRVYVDNLVILYELTIREKQRIQEEYLKNQLQLEQILLATCRVLSSLSMSAGIVVAPEKSYDTLKHVELIHVSGDEILMIIVTRSGSVIHKKLFLDGNMSQESLYQVSRFLNQNLMGRELEEISGLLEELKKDPNAPIPFHRTVEILKAGFQMEIKDEVEIYIDGLQNLVNQFKEDSDIQLEKFFSLVEDKPFLRNFFRRYATTDRVTTYIGDKNDIRMSGISIVAASYRMGEKKIGSMGILGPQRMNYNKALPLVEFTSKLVSEMITRLSN